MLANLSAEVLKLYKRPTTWVLLLVTLALSQVFNYLVTYAGYLRAENERVAERLLASTMSENLVANSIGGFPMFAGALALTLGAVTIGSEYGWGTLKTVLIQRLRRLSVYAGELLALAVAVLAIILSIFSLGALTGYAIAAGQSEPMNWPSAIELAQGAAAGWLILMTWCLLGAMLAFVFRGTALREVREAVAGYRQPTLDEELLGAREMLEAAGIECRIDNRVALLPKSVEGVLAWTVREGTTNVIRHSRAKRCEIRLSQDDHAWAEITDDGCGSPPGNDKAIAGSGLPGLAERVAASGGEFEANPLPEGGFRLRASLPLPDGGSQEGGRR